MSDLSKLSNEELLHYYKMYKEVVEGSKRAEGVKIYGFDLKFSYHIVRLLNEVEQIMTEGDLDLERNREQLKSIRRGEWKIEEIRDYFSKKEKELESVYLNSKLPYGPDEERIKTLLLSCLEEHYGSLDQAISKPDSFKNLLTDLQQILDKYSTRI